MDEYTDEELMILIQGRDHDAFSILVRRHTDRFYTLAYRVLFNQIEAEDVVQESFLKIWDKPSIWKRNKSAKFTTWFYQIVSNACYDHNKRKSSSSHISEGYDQVEARNGNPENDRLLSEVERALIKLPDRQRIAIALCFFDGLSNQEAADVLGIRLKALQSLLSRGKEALKMTLGIMES